jgi:pimeloyl-ACP methyl ester carboxylesterase
MTEANPTQRGSSATDATNAIRPFHVSVPETDLTELRRRVNATKWPERETVPDATQGVQLATMQALARYWGSDYDWRKIEAKINALPNYITEIDGLDIHFIHVRSKHENALPLIVTHGWPGSIIEQMKIIDPLTNPTAHGGSASDAFHVVIPSLPGYGYSGKPTSTGWDVAHIARVLGRTDEAPRLHAVRGARRRLGRRHHRTNGLAGGAGINRHSHQHAWRVSRGYRQGGRFRGAGAIESLSR